MFEAFASPCNWSLKVRNESNEIKEYSIGLKKDVTFTPGPGFNCKVRRDFGGSSNLSMDITQVCCSPSTSNSHICTTCVSMDREPCNVHLHLFNSAETFDGKSVASVNLECK